MTKKYPKLSKDIEVDVAIIGGGLAGIDTAYLLSETDLSVAVLESKAIGSGATSKTTAFLTQVIDTDYADMISMFGQKISKDVWNLHGDAIKTISQIVKTEKIDCDFERCPSFLFAQTEDDMKDVHKEYEAYQKLGFTSKMPAKNKLPFGVGAMEVPDQAKYYASKFIEQLAAKTAGHGVQIFEQTTVTKVSGEKNLIIHANGHKVRARDVIIATYDPLDNPINTKFKKGMYVSYVMELEIPKDSLPHALYEDTDNPYHYFRVDSNGAKDSMIIGGEDHREELPMDASKNYKALKEYIDKTFPKLKYKIKSRWKGPILEPSDGLPLIGEFAPHHYVACAFSGNGMTYSMIAAKIFRDMLTNKKNPYAKIFDPKRIPSAKQLASKFIDYGGELIGGAVKNALGI